jgi:hypothetical protein
VAGFISIGDIIATAADELQIESSFRAAIRTAKKQKSVSLAARAQASYSEYRARREERQAS